jgi:hypothetical protein
MLIDGMALGPEALKAIGQAFDEAWAEIAGNFGDDPREIEAARLKLANAFLSVASPETAMRKLLSMQRCKGWRWTIAAN